MAVDLMAEKIQQDRLLGPLSKEIEEFIDFKRRSGFLYTNSEFALKAFDRFCAALKNQALTPQQLAEAWVKPGDNKPKYDGGCCVRQLGQYLTVQGHPKAFTVFSTKGNAPRLLDIYSGPFVREIKEFVDQKRAAGRKYISEEYCLKEFDKFCAMKENKFLTPQQLADAWRDKGEGKYTANIGMIRELGMYLTVQGSMKSFVVPYANGDMPKPAFTGYTGLFAEEIVSFLKTKRSAGLKYRHEEFCLKDFDKFCNEQSNLKSPQQLADAFIHFQEERSYYKSRRSASVIKTFGNYLTNNCCSNAFNIIDKNFVAGPYAEEISAFVAFKKSCGFKYLNSGYHLRSFDVFCASKENESLTPQQLSDKWVLKRSNEHPNTRAGRIGPVRVFGKYLASIGHPKAFMIAFDAAKRRSPKPPYLFSEEDIDTFFGACAELKPDEKEPTMHIVLPAAFLFMHCMGVRTCELKILMENVNFETGEVIIADTKTGERTVYMSEELTELFFKYNLVIEKIFPRRKYLFSASVNRSRNDFAKNFREIWTSNVPAVKHGVPRLYDFRHHLLYRNVELCMRTGDDVNVLRPYLMRHMGHKLPVSFQYYFHLSPPIRKEVSQIKKSLDWMIPDIPKVPYE
jgi:integrase